MPASSDAGHGPRRSRICFSSTTGARQPVCAGGIISDMVAKRYGMRGRLWWLWSCQTIGGVLCIGLGLANNSFSSTMIVLCFFSFFVQVTTRALVYRLGSERVCHGMRPTQHHKGLLSLQNRWPLPVTGLQRSSMSWKVWWWVRNALLEPLYGHRQLLAVQSHPTCAAHLQGAAGALFSVVPFVSKRALGLVCGFVGAGGNTGSAITQARIS